MPELSSLAKLIRLELASVSVSIELRDGVIWIRRGGETVAVAPAETLLADDGTGRELQRVLRVGEAMLVGVGATRYDQFRSLMEQGVYDVHPEPPDPFRLATSVRNALDVQRLRQRASESAEQIRRNRYELREFMETARTISSERSIDSLLDTILLKCRDITCADAGTIYLVEGQGPLEERGLRFKLSQNDSIHTDWKEFVIPVSKSSIVGAAALGRQVINLPDVREIPPNSPFQHDPSFDLRTGYHTRSVLSAPMISQSDEVIGVVQLINCKRSGKALLLGEEDFDEQVVPFDARSVEIVRILGSHAAVSLENALLYDEVRRILDGFVKAAVHAIEQRDPPTSGHSERVAKLTLELARCVEMTWEGPYADVHFSDQEMLELRYAGLLHDFGKIGVPEAVLTKPKKLPGRALDVIEQRFEAARLSLSLGYLQSLGRAGDDRAELEARQADAIARLEAAWELVVSANEPAILDSGKIESLEQLGQLTYHDSRGVERPLVTKDELACLSIRKGSLTAEEFEEIKSHARKTDEFLSRIPWGKAFADLPKIASSHHEKIDGSGYPRGWSEAQIPLKAKMMAVADVYDALTSPDRPYKRSVPIDRALKILHLEAEAKHLDTELVRLFEACRVYESVEGGGSPDAS